MTFKRTEKQKEATCVLASGEEAALFGGSRSGKTFIIIRSILIRASKRKSRHLIVRKHLNHLKASIWHATLPAVLQLCFPDMGLQYNKSDWFVTLPNGSEIWFGGVEDKERIEKILGNEYSTIYINEASQVSYEAVTTLQTRMAENSGLPLRLWMDFNPPSKKHWSYKYIIEGIDPETLKPLPAKIPYLVMNPEDNKENLAPGYLERLDRLPKKQRDRFKLGLFTMDREGALWDYTQIIEAQAKETGEHVRRVVAVDIATTSNKNSDDTGIVAAEKDVAGEYRVLVDRTMKAKPSTWATAVMNLYDEIGADAVVVETNQGGDLIEEVLRLHGFKGKLIKVHAKKGKELRAEPIQALYEQGLVAHAEGLEALESEMMDWLPRETKESPNRIDAMVYALTELSGADSSLKNLLEIAMRGN